ncbi:MAG: ABC transporter substrate-binding protein [Candidatus Poribacteria bacterium]|nr:ABC transporter substrate-binding protein [Candidatus Poribacteria bacterium]MDE0504714.1 ABC transporter substrate-binding protein [Candidatus Poribacteria bacterium]
MNSCRLSLMSLLMACAVLIGGASSSDELVTGLPKGALPDDANTTGEITIGVVLSLTGPPAAAYGLPMQRGFELARDEINASQLGAPGIRLITIDDKGSVDGAVDAYRKLIGRHGVSVILGPGYSNQVRETFPIAQQNRIVAISSLSSATGLGAIGDFCFRVGLTNDVLIPSSVETTQAILGYQQVATLHDETDFYSTNSNQLVREALAANGVTLLAGETFQTGDSDYSVQLERIMALNPDAIFVSALAPDIPEIMIQGRGIGIPYSVPFIVPYMTKEEAEAAGAAAEDSISFTSWISAAQTPGNQEFVRNYRSKYGIEPETWAAQTYATLNILVEAMINAQSTNPTAIRNALANIDDFDTILGKFSFNESGDADYAAKILVVKEGELVDFDVGAIDSIGGK